MLPHPSIHHTQALSFPILPFPVCENLPLEWGRLWRLCLLSLVLALVSRILLFHDDVVVFGSVGVLGSIGVVGAVGSGGVEISLAGRFELFKGFENEGDRVLVGAAAFHVCCHVGPEGGGVGVFDLLFGGEEVLFLLVGRWLAGLRE